MSPYNDHFIGLLQQGIHAREPWLLLVIIVVLWLVEALLSRVVAGRSDRRGRDGLVPTVVFVVFRAVELGFLLAYVFLAKMCCISPVWALPLLGVFLYRILRRWWFVSDLGWGALAWAVGLAIATGYTLFLVNRSFLWCLVVGLVFLGAFAAVCFPGVRTWLRCSALLGRVASLWARLAQRRPSTGSGRPVFDPEAGPQAQTRRGPAEGRPASDERDAAPLRQAQGGCLAPFAATTSWYLARQPRCSLFYRGVRALVQPTEESIVRPRALMRALIALATAAGLVLAVWGTAGWGFWREMEVRMLCLWPVLRLGGAAALAVLVGIVAIGALLLRAGVRWRERTRRRALAAIIVCLVAVAVAVVWVWQDAEVVSRSLSQLAYVPLALVLLVAAAAMVGVRPLGTKRRAGTPDSPFFLKCLQRERALALERYHAERYGASSDEFLGGAGETIECVGSGAEAARQAAAAADGLAGHLIERFAPSRHGQFSHLERYVELSEAELEYHRFDRAAGDLSSYLDAADASDLIASVYQEAAVECEVLSHNLPDWPSEGDDPRAGLAARLAQAVRDQRHMAAGHAHRSIECREAYLGLDGGKDVCAKAEEVSAMMQHTARPPGERLVASMLLCSYAQVQGLEAPDPYATRSDIQVLCCEEQGSFERLWTLAEPGQLEGAVAKYLDCLLTIQPTRSVFLRAEDAYESFRARWRQGDVPERVNRLTGDIRLRAAGRLEGMGEGAPESVRRINVLYARGSYQWWSLYALLLLSKARRP